MRNKPIFAAASVLGVVAVFLLPRALLSAAEPEAPAGLIQMQVTIPATPSPTADRDVGERFVDAAADAFRGWGYRGKVQHLNDLDEPDPDGVVLRINLSEWQGDHTGNVVCRFAAMLVSGGREQSLGTFHGMAPGIAIAPGRFGASRAFDDAARDALTRLYDALAKSELIVGLRPR